MDKTPSATDVLVELQAGPPGEKTFICIPQAGAGAAQFNSFTEPLKGSVSAWAVRFPGRENRLLEQPLGTIGDMAAALLGPVTRLGSHRIVLLGHCSGALVAFELAHLLEDAGFDGIAALAVSAEPAPSTMPESPHRPASALTLTELTEHLRALGGTPERVLARPEMMELLAPGIRADFEAVERYSSRAGRRQLAMPILAMRGRADALVTTADLHQWGEHTSGVFIVEEFDGGHFYLTEQRHAIHRVLLNLIDRRNPGSDSTGVATADRASRS